MRSVCVPDVAKYTGGPRLPHPLSVQPHPCGAPPPGPFCSTGSSEEVVPIRAHAEPPLFTESLNCRWIESFPSELDSARIRTHRWYATPLCAVNDISK